MRRLILVLTVLGMAVCLKESCAEGTKGVAAARPSVVRTTPECGDRRVDPTIKEIRATFSKDMTDGCWSWCTAEEGEFPEMVGQPRYLPDKRTCVLGVKLKPKTTYAIWLNSHKFHNFKDRDGRPAVAYLLVFETR